MSEWKSPRKVEEEMKQYKYNRFDSYMDSVRRGELTRNLALAAFADETEYLELAD